MEDETFWKSFCFIFVKLYKKQEEAFDVKMWSGEPTAKQSRE